MGAPDIGGKVANMRERRGKLKNRKGQRGFVLLVMGVTAVVVAGFLGLAMDVGRTYITKNEAQAFADAGALAAALNLDGTSAGVTNAQTAATSVGNKWNFATTAFSGTTVEVATSSAGPWTSASSPPSPATNYTYVRVTASASVNLYFAPVVTAWWGSALMTETVRARSVAAQLPQTTWNTGAFPFSPIAFDGPTGGSNATNPWGFVAGQQYTMRYASNGKSECAGDAADTQHRKAKEDRGYWGSNSAATASGEIEGLIQEESLTVGAPIPAVGGAKTSVAAAIDYHIALDGDTTDTTYAAYLANPAHNGERVVTMPIQSELAPNNVLGFGSFLLTAAGTYDHKGNADWCAIYIGQAGVTDSSGPGASSTAGAYQVKLVQ
jgi:Flp pilus assembly protein TadG